MACYSVQRHEAASREGLKNFHLCFTTFSMKCGHHGIDLKVIEEDVFLSCSMMIKAKNIIMKERMWNNRVDERIIPVREEPSLHVEHQRDESLKKSEFLEERRLKDLVKEFAALRTSESVCRYTGYKRNNVEWPEALTLKFVILAERLFVSCPFTEL